MSIFFDQEILQHIGSMLFNINSLIDMKSHLINFDETTPQQIIPILETITNINNCSKDLYKLILNNIKTN